MNPADMKRQHLKKLEAVDIISVYDGVERRAQRFRIVPYEIPSGNRAAYFPETNVLVPFDHFADGSNIPISKSIKVQLTKADQD